MDHEVLAAKLLASSHRAQITATLQAALEVGTAAYQADPLLHITDAAVMHHGYCKGFWCLKLHLLSFRRQ
jgi:hypothetical protein